MTSMCSVDDAKYLIDRVKSLRSIPDDELVMNPCEVLGRYISIAHSLTDYARAYIEAYEGAKVAD